MKKRATVIIALLVLFPLLTVGRSVPSAVPGKAISADELYSWCKFLSGPQFAGRLTGHEGYAAAARWAAEKMRDLGLKPAYPGQGFLQPFPCAYTLVDSAEMTLLVPDKSAGEGASKAAERVLVPREDFLPYFFSGSGSVEVEAVFVGWGISAPELGYDDYAGIDVKGKFVFCFQGTPRPSDPAFGPHNRHLVRQKTAREKGAAGIFYIQTAIVGSTNGDWKADFFPGVVSESVGDTLLAERSVTSAAVRQALKTYARPLSFPLKTRVRYAVQSTHIEKATTFNVVGILPGSDPKLRGEFLVIGGHLDHLGRQLGKTYYGANDNASGSAVVLGLAKAFSLLPSRPKRSIVFVLFAGEEMGLAGSRFFVDNPPPSLKTFGAMFNFDMNGVGNGLTCYRSRNGAELVAALQRADQPTRLLGDLEEATTPSGSDYAAFLLKEIPFLSFFSNNFETKYHVPEDTYYQVNPDIMADIAGVAFRTAMLWADR